MNNRLPPRKPTLGDVSPGPRGLNAPVTSRPPGSALTGAGAPRVATRRPKGVNEGGRRKPGGMSPVLRFINALMTFFVVGGLALGCGLIYIMSGIDADGPLDEPKLVAVPRNDGTLSIAERLERDGVISNRHTFLVAYYLLSRHAAWNNARPLQLKAGEYEFKRAVSVRSVIETLSEGRSILAKITVPEGLTSFQVVERLKADPTLIGEIREIPAEGSLLPETYQVPRGSTRQSVLDMMAAAQKKLVEQLWAERQAGLPLASPAEALVLASIIEKETGKNDERERVAAVFVNRLKAKPPMRLESDPTILYGKFTTRTAWGTPILKSWIREATAHNTYVIQGLPPTPICNPGRAAIEATLKPAQTKELFFMADGRGGHIFSELLKDHQAAERRYRLLEQERAAAKAGAPAPAPSSAPVMPTTINTGTPPKAASPVPVPKKTP